MLILVPAALGHALSLAQNLSIAAISFVVATATLRTRRAPRASVHLAVDRTGPQPQARCRPDVRRRRRLRAVRVVAAKPHRKRARACGIGCTPCVDQGTAGGGRPGAVAAVPANGCDQRTGGPLPHGPGRACQPGAEPAGRQRRRTARLRRRLPRQLHRHVTAALRLRRHDREHHGGALRRLPRLDVVPRGGTGGGRVRLAADHLDEGHLPALPAAPSGSPVSGRRSATSEASAPR